MQEERVVYLMEKFKDNLEVLEAAERCAFKNRLSAASDEAFAPLNTVTLKNKIAALLLSIFLGGVCAGRFYVGDYKFAIIKIVASILISVVSGLLLLVPILGLIIFITASVGLTAWNLVEIYFCYKRAREVNVEKLNDIIAAYSVSV